MNKLPDLINKQIIVDTELQIFLDNLENYPEDLHNTQISLFYQQQVECAANIANRVNSWCWAITKLESEAEYYRSQAQRFSKLAKTTENQAKYMKGFIKLTVEKQGGKLPTEHFPKLRVQKTKATLVIDDLYEGNIPQGLIKKLPLSEVLDKTKVREMIEAGHNLSFAQIAEGGTALYGLK